MLVLFTDTDTDFSPEKCKKYGYHLISMPYSIDEKLIYPWVDYDTYDYKSFYDKLRNGTIPKTSAISTGEYEKYFRPHFENGDDILYVHFSSALSGSFNAMHQTVSELLKEFPNCHFYEIDTKMITIGAHAIVSLVGEKALTGATAEELVNYGNELVKHYAMYFFAEDLKFFSYSGRISNFAASMGRLLGFRAIIYLNEEGQMINIGKERGRKGAIKNIVNRMVENGDHVKDYPILIGHSDAFDAASELGEAIKKEFGEDTNIQYIVVNPTIGSHCGPQGCGVSYHSKGK